jgi:hypothetical protein
VPETIEGLRFRVSAAWLASHMAALAAHYERLLERLEELLLARVERESLKPEAIARANQQSSDFRGRARFWRELSGLLGDADRIVTSGDLSGISFPIPEHTDADLLGPILGEPLALEFPFLVIRRGRGEPEA